MRCLLFNWKITKVTTTNKAICTVYGKTASYVMLKGKGVGRATISVKAKTTRRKYPNNIKIMKCRANVTAAAPSETAFSASAVANSNTEVRVTFSQEIDAPEAANFTVSDSVTVSKAELSEDKKSVVLTIAGAEYGKNYDLTVSGIKVGGKEQAEQKLTFTTPAATEKYPMTLEVKDPILKSDGSSQTVVTFTIKDENGNPITDKGVEVAFTTSLGKFAEQRVSIQNGVATVMYTSESLMETQTAQITATVVESTQNQELLGLYTTGSITLTPNPEAFDDTSVGAIITSATAATADRVIAYFNQPVKAADFKTESGKIDFSKFDCSVQSGLDNGFEFVEGVSQKHNIKGILDVESEENALQLLVDKPMTDNTNIKVDFENKTKSNSLISPKNTVYFKLTDARQPSAMGASGNGMREITVEFSEAVLPTILCQKITGAERFAADNPDNYLIDGVPISDLGVTKDDIIPPEEEQADSTDGSLAVISEKFDEVKDNQGQNGSIQVGSYSKDGDKRYQVTIKLGRKYYLPTGMHRISISNVGDWAAMTDRERNIVNTQGFDFEVASNDVLPTFTVTEQSPEQWLVSFNSDVETVSSSDYIRTRNSATSGIASVIKLQQRVGSDWVDISTSSESDKNPIRVSQIDDTNDYIVEVTRDWTQVYNTPSTRLNYFNYDLRLHIDANKIVNLANDKKNEAINVDLNGSIMKSPDTESPVIGEVVPATDKSGNVLDSYNVTLSEPVKLSPKANLEGLTPSKDQEAGTNATTNTEMMGIPAPSAEFISVDNGQTVRGIVLNERFMDAEDRTINITPENTLSAGDWRLVISSISDDYGRTTATATQTISVVRDTKATGFRIVWAAVGNNLNYATARGEGTIGRGKGRYIYVKFNKPVTMVGNSVNAQATANYTINGNTLPTGTDIMAHIKGYDDHIKNVTDSITIVLPQGNFTDIQNFTVDAQNAMLNVSRAITSTTGETLENGGLIRIPFQYGSAPNNVVFDDINVPTIASLQAKTDAVWGNAEEEQLKADATSEETKEYYRNLKAALESDQYRRVVLSHNLNLTATDDKDGILSVFGRSGTLTINRAVDIDLNGYNIDGNVVVSTTDSADSVKINNSRSAVATSTITGKAATNSNTATLTVEAGRIRDFAIENVTVKANGGKAILLNDVYVDTFTNKGAIEGDILVTDNNGFGFDNQGTVTNGKLIIDTNGDVNLKGDIADFAATGIVVKQAAKVFFGTDNAGVDVTGVIVDVRGKSARIIMHQQVSGKVTIVANAKDVRVTYENGQVDLQQGVNGEFVRVDKDNNKDGVTQPTAGDIAKSDLLSELDKIDLLQGKIASVTIDGNQTISASAITGTGLNIKELETAVSDRTVTVNGNSHKVKAEYALQSPAKLVQSNGTVITRRDPVDSSATASTQDTIRVTLTCDDLQYVREIKITNN